MAAPSRIEGRVTERLAGGSGPRDFLTLLGHDDRTALEQLGRRVSLPPGTVLMHEGLYAEGVIVVLRGLVKVTCVTRSGRESILGFCGQGELIGELAAIDEQPHGSTVVSITPVDAFVVPSRGFRAFLQDRPSAGSRS